MQKGIEQKILDNLGKGVNTFTRDTMINDEEASEATDVWSVGKNSIEKRPGYVRYVRIGNDPIDGIGVYYSGATRKILAMAGGMLYDVTGGSASRVGSQTWTTGNKVDFCQAGGKLFIANGVEALRYYDGSTTADQTGGVILKYLLFYKGCLWGIGNPSAGNETRMYRSGNDENVGNFTYTNSASGVTTSATANKLVDSAASFSVANVTVGCTVLNTSTGVTAIVTAIDSGTTLSLDKDIFVKTQSYVISNNSLATSVYVSKADGQFVTGFFKHQDYIYPTKETSLWRASVASDAYGTITLEMVDPARGCSSHNSIDTVENDNFMFNEMGVYATGYEPNILDQIRTNILSLRIDQKLKSIQKSRLPFVQGVYFDNHYYLSYTAGGGTVNDTIMVYDRQRLGWWEWKIGASCFCEYKNISGETKLYFGSEIDGSIYYFDQTAKSDNGVSFPTLWRSPKYSFKDYSQSKVFLNVLLYFAKTSGLITYTIFIDGETSSTDTIKIGNTGYAGMGIDTMGVEKLGVGGGSLELSDSGGGDFVKIPVNKIGRNIQIQIEDNTSDKSWQLNALVFQFKKINELYQPGI